MSGKEVLTEVQRGFRMPKPVGCVIPCSDAYFGVMSVCWKAKPEERPTFEFLHDTFENWEVSAERQYDSQGGV
jgi:hypothetical protein